MPDEVKNEPIWYAAHVILYIEFLDGVQDSYTVWENIYLIHADTVAEAFAKADSLGEEEATMDPDSWLTSKGRPARWRFAGVRRLAECIDFENGPEDGKEVAFLEYTFKDKATLDALIQKQDAVVTIESAY